MLLYFCELGQETALQVAQKARKGGQSQKEVPHLCFVRVEERKESPAGQESPFPKNGSFQEPEHKHKSRGGIGSGKAIDIFWGLS